MTTPPILCVSVAEFDIDIGNTLTATHPSAFDFAPHDPQTLANLCLPDGAHLVEEDWTFLFLTLNKVDQTGGTGSAADSAVEKSGAADGKGEDQQQLYGIGFYRNVKDETVRRGYVQQSLLLVSTEPLFNVYLPLCRAALVAFMGGDKKAPRVLYEGLNASLHRDVKLRLFGEDMHLNVPVLREDEYGGASLIDLVRLFKEDTMLLWYALLLGQRILFVGQPANRVCNCVIAAPLLVAPLRGFAKIIHPYVSLYELDRLMVPRYICGATNMVLEMKTDFFDALGSFGTGTVLHQGGLKVTGSDRQLIKNVINGIQDNRGEQWVRAQFRNHTEMLLRAVKADSMKGVHRRAIPEFPRSQIYKDYLVYEREAQERENDGGADIIDPEELLATLARDGVGKIERTKAFFHLDALCNDLVAVDRVVEAEGVRIVCRHLGDDSAQVRKYAMNVLSQLAGSVRGILSIVAAYAPAPRPAASAAGEAAAGDSTSNEADAAAAAAGASAGGDTGGNAGEGRKSLLSRIVEMIADPMPNVSSAACNCLWRMSTLYTGCVALADPNIGIGPSVTDILMDLATSHTANMTMKIVAARTLVQLFHSIPSLPIPNPAVLMQQLLSPDRRFTQHIVALLDHFGMPVPPIAPSGELDAVLTGLAFEDRDLKSRVTSQLLSKLNEDSSLVWEFVDRRGIDVLLGNQLLGSAESRLSRYAYFAYARIADTNHGARQLVRQGVVKGAVESLRRSKNPLYLFAVARFLEVAAQHYSSAVSMNAKGAVMRLADLVERYHGVEADGMNIVCLPAMSALCRLATTLPDQLDTITDAVSPLADAGIVPPPRERAESTGESASSSATGAAAVGIAAVSDEIAHLGVTLSKILGRPQSEESAILFARAQEAEAKYGTGSGANLRPVNAVDPSGRPVQMGRHTLSLTPGAAGAPDGYSSRRTVADVDKSISKIKKEKSKGMLGRMATLKSRVMGRLGGKAGGPSTFMTAEDGSAGGGGGGSGGGGGDDEEPVSSPPQPAPKVAVVHNANRSTVAGPPPPSRPAAYHGGGGGGSDLASRPPPPARPTIATGSPMAPPSKPAHPGDLARQGQLNSRRTVVAPPPPSSNNSSVSAPVPSPPPAATTPAAEPSAGPPPPVPPPPSVAPPPVPPPPSTAPPPAAPPHDAEVAPAEEPAGSETPGHAAASTSACGDFGASGSAEMREDRAASESSDASCPSPSPSPPDHIDDEPPSPMMGMRDSLSMPPCGDRESDSAAGSVEEEQEEDTGNGEVEEVEVEEVGGDVEVEDADGRMEREGAQEDAGGNVEVEDAEEDGPADALIPPPVENGAPENAEGDGDEQEEARDRLLSSTGEALPEPEEFSNAMLPPPSAAFTQDSEPAGSILPPAFDELPPPPSPSM